LKGEDAKDGRKQYAELLSNPAMLAERIDWMLAGNYGFGAMIRARAILSGSERNNKQAQLCMLLAALDCNCKNAMARSAWLKLSVNSMLAVGEAVEKAIAEYQASI